jgi:hypothetical protein
LASSQHDTITLGNGNADSVTADSSSYDTITLGNGINDMVSADSSSYDTITLGNGAGDTMNVDVSYSLAPTSAANTTQLPSVMVPETP